MKTISRTRDWNEAKEQASASLKISIPLIGTARTPEGVQEYEGRLEAIGEGRARIFFDHPLAPGTELTVRVEFRDRRNREIRFRYEGRVESTSCNPWYDVVVGFDEGVSISGKDARELLSEIFPEEV